MSSWSKKWACLLLKINSQRTNKQNRNCKASTGTAWKKGRISTVCATIEVDTLAPSVVIFVFSAVLSSTTLDDNMPVILDENNIKRTILTYADRQWVAARMLKTYGRTVYARAEKVAREFQIHFKRTISTRSVVMVIEVKRPTVPKNEDLGLE